jgi:hypothetical protein
LIALKKCGQKLGPKRHRVDENDAKRAAHWPESRCR